MTPGKTVLLHQIAHGRSGDKGNRLNVNVIAYEPRHWDVLREQVTEERVAALFAHRGATRVKRYELPRLNALNFVIDDALEGGVNASLSTDTHGKCLSFLVLGLEIRLPAETAPA
ncbi:AtuA-related protein [Martelella sp. FOR1707]